MNIDCSLDNPINNDLPHSLHREEVDYFETLTGEEPALEWLLFAGRVTPVVSERLFH